MRITGYLLASYLLASYLLASCIVVSYLATSYLTVVKGSRTTLLRVAHQLHRLRDVALRTDPWHVPGKQETCVEWLREIHGTRDWCVKAAQ
jgi:hypothetical protein